MIPRLLCVSTCYCPPSPSSKVDKDIMTNNNADLDIMSMVANMTTGHSTFTNPQEEEDLEEDDSDIMDLVSGMVAKDDVATDDSDILSLVSGMVGHIVEVGDIDEDSGKFEPPVDSSPSIEDIGRRTLERARKRKQKNPKSRSPKLSPNSRKKAW